ncbi:hypothetical protein N7517_010331 [Penicillium concentricum]|uniref:Uncharacterized protein n=1 Tax=Penicillium concentricum TaxID=293559 RepID=A0A9W9USH9_9EURO|nr:uncharacterized protein N7517_010331 [Penicillium concentricum]KAJ5355722.1 hypothetical protein N7517_010331 [Penicillium concentricum]
MRLHLVISRHGLPVTRILWTTTSSNSVLGEYGTHRPASTAAVASSRTPNIAFSNGGYTVAQLLEDVNEVVPLETEPSVFDAEFSGQWGLEDYVVEVAGSECLHFMEVDGLLRDGDEVVIRALQLADLRTRRLCGRHQITAEGKHLIDGVPFGSPFLKRTTSTRPAITIPPRKKRRTVFSGWENAREYVPEEVHADEEGDGEWLPPPNTGFGKELSIMPAEHEESLGTVIRHPVDHTAESDSEADMSEMPGIEEDELESELQALKEDFEEASQFVDIRNQTQNASGHTLRAASIVKRPTSKGSLAAASSLSSKRSRAEDSSPRASKAVRFNKGHDQEDEDMPDLPQPPQAPHVEESAAETSDSDSSDSSASSSDSDADNGSDDDDSSSEVEPAAEAPSDSDSDSDSSSSSEDSDSSDSDSEEEPPRPVEKVQQPVSVGPPGEGSIRTKKSNNRIKLRRRLSKLKELGALPQQAGFDALREWEDKHGGWHTPEQYLHPEPFVKPQLPVEPQPPVEPEQESAESSSKKQKREKKEQEKKEFEARREKLLRDLASGHGVDVGETSEKENVPPVATTVEETPVSEEVPGEDQLEQEPSNRRTLDIASSRRMLFGSLGMRTPKTKEEEEATRRKLAAKASACGRRNKVSTRDAQEETDQMQEDEDASDLDWQNKLVIRAVECLYPQVDMTAPPYPFVQRWDQEANALIRELKGPNKKRKRKQRVQVYEEYEEQEEYDENGNYYGHDDQYQGGDDQANHEGYYEGEADPHHEGHWEGEAAPYYEGHYAGEAEGDQINYDDAPEPEQASNPTFDDLPSVPADIGSIPDLTESEAKVGAIIAFRQLDMSKATNWQPQMSEYRVAEVRSVKDHGVINVLLAKRDRRPPSASGEDDEPRQFSKFEVPDLANDEGEDDGYRELAFAELSDPKLLQPAAQSGAESEDQDNTREGSIVSVVHESVPNAQPALSEEMYLDDTTFVTIGNEVSYLETRSESPGAPDEPIQQTPGRGLPQIQVQTGSDGRSVTPPIPSPSFNGFHSARSWQQTTPGAELSRELEGHTLIGGETPSALVNRDEDPSVLSYASANQSFADELEDQEMSDHQEHERQVVAGPLMPPGDSGDSGPQSGSLLSTIDRSGNGGASSSLFVKRDTVREKHSATPNSSSESWRDLLNRLRNGPSEPSESVVTSEDNNSEDNVSEDNVSEDNVSEDNVSEGNQSPQRLEDSLQHSYLDLNFSPLDSPRASNSRSPLPPMSAQQDAQSQKQNSFPSPFETESPAASTRSKFSQRVHEFKPTSQIPASQASEVIDLTSSPRGSPEPSNSNTNPSERSKSARYGNSQRENTPRSSGRPSRASTGKLQRMVEVSISPSSQKKRRSSRKF